MGVWAVGVVLVWLLVLSAYDITQRRLPNWLTLPGGAVILAVSILFGHGMAAVTGAAALAVVYLLVHLVAPAALGGGDVKLAAAMALFAGPSLMLDFLLVVGIVGGVLGIIMLAGVQIGPVAHAGGSTARGRLQSRLPYGPAIAAGGLWVVATLACALKSSKLLSSVGERRLG